MAKSSAPVVVPQAAEGTTVFYLKKAYIRPIANAIAQLQERTDISGKFARKIGRVRRAISKADEEIQAQRQDLVKAHSEKYPEGHAEEGKPTPVYLSDPQTGAPIFKKDKAGNDTEDRIVVPDQYNVSNPAEFQNDMKLMLDEIIVVSCPAFKEDEFNAFKGISGKIVDPLMYLEEGSETTVNPVAPTAAGLELVKDDEPQIEETVGEAAAAEEGERGAP